MIKLIASSLIMSVAMIPSMVFAAVQSCIEQAPYGIPLTSKQSITTICRKAYVIGHDNNAKIPQWVSYMLSPNHTIGCIKRSNSFVTDTTLPVGSRSELSDYAKSTYDTGHMANSADMAWDYDVERESFILSNMAPQLPEFNRGVWKRLEDQTRAWAVYRRSTILIYTGPIYNLRHDSTIGATRVTIPHGFFKILVDTSTNEVLPFKFVHEASHEPLYSFMTSLAEVQRLTGVIFPVPTNYTVSATIWGADTKSVRRDKRAACALK